MSNPNASSPVDPQVLTLFQDELARAAAMPGLAAASPKLWPGFARYYQGLAHLPRKARRALQRRWRRSLGGIALLCALGQAPALAATIFVDGTTCTLVDAITAANSDAPTGGCTAGSGADGVLLPIPDDPVFFGNIPPLTAVNNNTYGPTGLPVITSTITISRFFDGRSTTITRDTNAPEFRILAVGETGNLTLHFTTVSGGVTSGSGGGIYNLGTLTLDFSTVSGNSASSGGGIASFGTLTLTDSWVLGNSARNRVGGGILHFRGTATLIDSTVSGNFSTSPFGLSGGIVNSDGAMTLTNSTVSGNSAGYGVGGITNAGSGTLTLTDSTVTGNTAGYVGGISNDYFGTVTLTNSTVSGNTARVDGGGINNSGGTLTLTDSTVSGNTAGRSGGGIRNSDGIVTLTNSTVSGNSAAGDGGGISIPASGTVTLTNSSVDGNSAQSRGGGIFNAHGSDYQGTHSVGMVTLTNSAVSGNTAGTSGGGVSNGDLLTLTNSTVSGNTAADRGGGVDSSGTVTLTSSTVSRNASGGVAGGLFNTGTVTLVQSLLSGNTAPVIGPEAYNVSGNVIGDSFNVFGHDGFSGVAGFTLGATDLVPAVPLSAILAPTLGYNGGPTKTHTLVFGSPGVDTIPGAACATGTDQRGAPRPQDADGDTVTDCDSGAVERGLIPIQAEITNTTLDCNRTACRVSVRCNQETERTNPIDIAVRTRALRASDGTLVKASKLIRFAAGATNVPPGGTQQLRVKLTKQGKRLVRATKKRRLKGVLGIREIAATVSNTPLTISRTDVTIRLKRRK